MIRRFVWAALLLGQLAGLSRAEAADPEETSLPSGNWGSVIEPAFPFFSSVLDARQDSNFLTNNLTPRGLILNLGNSCWACFDVDLLRMSAIWVGDGITPISMAQGSYHLAGAKAKEGQEKLPRPMGTVWLVNGIYPGWQSGVSVSLTDPRDPGPDPREVGRGPLPVHSGRFKNVRLTKEGTLLEYEVLDVPVREWVTARMEGSQPIVERRFRLESVPQQLWLVLGRAPVQGVEVTKPAISIVAIDSSKVVERVEQADGLIAVLVHSPGGPVEFQVNLGMGTLPVTPRSDDRPQTPTPRRWPQTVKTSAQLSGASDAYVLDNISLPVDNPWKRNVRLADLAFFRDGRAGAVTFDGDVWIISGLHDDLREVVWQRFASGLHEPLGITSRDEQLYVFDRNGIWCLRDTDGNGEADVHELFSNAFSQTAETREYAHGIRVAPDGSFIIAKGGIEFTTLGQHNGTVLRVAPDGKAVTVLASGLRSPFIGVHPVTGLVTASDQQGYYIPSTPLHLIHDGQFYGFLPSIVAKEKYPAPIAEPLTWIPHPINASGAAQVWLTGARMGPLNDSLVHLGYYRPELFLVLLNQRTSRTQAAVVSVTRDFAFAPLSGAVNPIDGQLYVTGFQIFGTVAKQLSGLARFRYTGAPSLLPRQVVPTDKGVLLRFDVALDPAKALDAANFSAERWNYQRTANYGSPHFKLDGSKGQDSMTPSSAYLSADGKSVFVGIPEMKPVMQMRLGWALATQEGAIVEQNAYFTPSELIPFDPAADGFAPLAVDLTSRSRRVAPAASPVTSEEGRKLSVLMGCVACHSTDGSTLGKIGPTWKGLFGSSRKFADGSQLTATETYLRESVREPSLRIVSGFEKSDTGMPSYEGVISEPQIEALVLYIKSIH